MNDAISIRDGIEPQRLPPQGNSLTDALFKKAGVNRFRLIGSEQPKRDARMTIIKTAADPLAIAVEDIDHGPANEVDRRLLHHLLKDPRVRRPANDLEADLRQSVGHA